MPSLAGKAFDGLPGLVTPAQLSGWRKVTDAVHAERGVIVAQVMHGGRAGHSDISGLPVEVPSALAIDGETRVGGKMVAYPVPHALRTDELPVSPRGLPFARHGSAQNSPHPGADAQTFCRSGQCAMGNGEDVDPPSGENTKRPAWNPWPDV